MITEKVPSALSSKENTMYQMIALRLLEAVSETCVREIVATRLQVLHYDFKIKAVNVLEPGWRGIQNEFNDNEAMESEVPELTVGDLLAITGSAILEKQHRGPQLFTEATLLTRIEHVIGNIYDPDTKQAFRGVGLGTPATRAGIIETLLGRHYIEREGKALVPTARGKPFMTWSHR
jgi:DNA topoisomerase III